MLRRTLVLTTCASSIALVLAVVALPATGQQQPQGDQPLPTRGVVIDIDSPERALYKIAIPDLRGGSTAQGGESAQVIRNDLHLVSLFEVLDPRSFLADPNTEGLNITLAGWSPTGAQGVVKGEIRGTGNSLTVEMRFYEIARGTTALLTRTYRGGPNELRGFMHDFANELLNLLTGERGAFGTRLAFARRAGPGRKDVFVADFDGHQIGRISSGRGVALLPSFGSGGVWYSVLGADSMFITRSGSNERSIIGGPGLNMGVTICGNRAYFTSTRDGNAEIYSAGLDGSDVRRLTNHPGIDVSPACGPGGQIAFVSERHGGPQIFTMDGNGGGVRRITYRGNHNQTPAWCPDARKPLIAFTGRDGGAMDIFVVNVQTQEYTRLTQAQGVNKDPAFSPDCRMVAFASSRGGIFISNPEGLNQNMVVPGAAETVRWSR